jgi:hypothetical protein
MCLYAAEFKIGTDAELALVETAAAVKFRIETQTAAICRGERVDQGDLGRLSCELRTVLADLKRSSSTSAPAPVDNLYAAVLISDDEDKDDD